jgi:hypothetical protein
MKKLLNKIRRKPQVEESSRITTETIAEHRERVLAGGRRFKYPLQYSRHRLVFNAIIIGVAALLLLFIIGWWQLYPAQNTSDFMYRVTRVLPVNVASVDGYPVRYSDYLMKYRSSIHYLVGKEQLNLNTEDGKRQSDFVKQREMENSVADAYAAKLAKELNLSVSDAELEAFLKLQRSSPDGEISQVTYDAVVLDYYGWSADEYRHAMSQKLLRQKVAYAVDTKADKTVAAITSAVSSGNTDLKAIAESVNNGNTGAQVAFANQGWVSKKNQDGGLAEAAGKLQKGQVSAAIKATNGDGYYFVKVLDINDTQVNYDYVHIPLSVFAEQLEKIKADGKVTEYIDIPEVDTSTNQ